MIKDEWYIFVANPDYTSSPTGYECFPGSNDACGGLTIANLIKSNFRLSKMYEICIRSEAENQCFCKALTTVRKIMIFRYLCKGGIERNPQKSTKSRFFANFGSRFEASQSTLCVKRREMSTLLSGSG